MSRKSKSQRDWLASLGDKVKPMVKNNRPPSIAGVIRNWPTDKRVGKKHYKGPCAYCTAPATTMDHVVPIAKGGSDQRENLVRACVGCNQLKATRSWVPLPRVR